MREEVKRLLRPIYPLALPAFSLFHRHFLTPWNIRKNKGKSHRMLEIGPGLKRLEGFETINVISGLEVDYVLNASNPLPFEVGSFDLIYASHVLEHIPWHQIRGAVADWVRILKPGGTIEIWVPDGYKLCRLFCDLDEKLDVGVWRDGWSPNGLVDSSYMWANGRLLYGVRDDYPSWHKSVITPGFLEEILGAAGVCNIQRMDSSQVRGHDHGWINLGLKGVKP